MASGTNLEEALAALAGAHSVVLARCVIPAHRAQPLRAQRSSAGRGRRLVVHKVVAVCELERVREPSGAQNTRVVQRLLRPGRVQVHGHIITSG